MPSSYLLQIPVPTGLQVYVLRRCVLCSASLPAGTGLGAVRFPFPTCYKQTTFAVAVRLSSPVCQLLQVNEPLLFSYRLLPRLLPDLVRANACRAYENDQTNCDRLRLRKLGADCTQR